MFTNLLGASVSPHPTRGVDQVISFQVFSGLRTLHGLASHHWGPLGAEFGDPRILEVSPFTIPCGAEWVSPREVVSTCECVWLLYAGGGGLWGALQTPGYSRCLDGEKHSVAAFFHPPFLSSPPIGPMWYLHGWQGMQGMFAWPHGVLAMCLRAPEPLFFLFYPQSPPGSSRNPRTRLVCQGVWPPSCVRPQVTPSHG